MIISISKPSSKRIDFNFSPDSGDAALPVLDSYITGDNLHRLRDGALSIISFLIVKDCISSRVLFEGLEVPAYQAAIFHDAFDGSEFYCHPVSYIDRAIMPKTPIATQEIISDREVTSSSDIIFRQTNLGFEARRKNGGGEEVHSFTSSIPFFASMSCRDPLPIIDAIMVILGMEIFDAYVVRDTNGRFQKNLNVRRILADSGVSLVGESSK